MYKELKRLIPTAVALGGAILGLLSVAVDLMGAIGSGANILIAATTICSCAYYYLPSLFQLLMSCMFKTGKSDSRYGSSFTFILRPFSAAMFT
jgi:preprotein translocase subunit SecY